MRLAVPLLAALALAVVVPLGDAHSGIALVRGRGILAGGSDACPAAAGAAALDLTLTRLQSEAWRVEVVLRSVTGCPASGGGVCDGQGLLAEGVVITNCQPLGGSGRLENLSACTPGPMAPPPLLDGSADFSFESPEGPFAGSIDVVFAGDATEEAPNPCV